VVAEPVLMSRKSRRATPRLRLSIRRRVSLGFLFAVVGEELLGELLERLDLLVEGSR
jgi:hypothetical protein